MNRGGLLAAFLIVATVALVVAGTLWPVPAAVAYAGGGSLVGSSSTPEAAATNLGSEIRSQDWDRAYAGLANKVQFTEQEFIHDLRGYYPSLRTNATLSNFEVFPLHSSDDEAQVLREADGLTERITAVDDFDPDEILPNYMRPGHNVSPR